MKSICIFVFVLSLSFISAQKFNSQEKELILSGDQNTALPIYQTDQSHQHSVLLAHSSDISPKDKNLPHLIDRMKVALERTGGGVGIAGPQVGINRNIILVQRFDKANNPVEYFINPKIIWKSTLQNIGPEGDLSIAEFRDMFYRSQVIQLEYFDLKGKKQKEMVEGFTAVIFQHEIDHLFGVLISDKVKNDANKQYKKVDAFQIID